MKCNYFHYVIKAIYNISVLFDYFSKICFKLNSKANLGRYNHMNRVCLDRETVPCKPVA